MKLPLHIAKILITLLESENKISSSKIKHTVVTKMIEDGVLRKQQISNSKAFIFIPNKEPFKSYVSNHFGINDIEKYIDGLEKNELTRADNIAIASHSKTKQVRTFKGFLVNSYLPIKAILKKEEIIIQPTKGCFTFISDFVNFKIDESVTIVGIENAENFSNIEKQTYLFEHIKPLFVCRYPQNQSKDLINWLQQIPNHYLHFGDLDFAGISIYQNEFKKYLGEKANLFLPKNTEELLQKFGNRELFNNQHHTTFDTNEKSILQLIELLHKYKKGLEQEIFIKK